MLKNNTVALAKAAKVFNIPTIITTVETESFSGNTYPELLDVFPGSGYSGTHVHELGTTRKCVMHWPLTANAKWWSPVCGQKCATTSLCAMLEGNYEIYMVADASGGTSKEAHDYAMQRMIQAGVIPMTGSR